MSIPNRQIGWSNESNLLWGIAKQMQQLNGILGKGGCCGGGASGCITHTDITWDELNAKNSTGTLQDCFYNVIDRPNSGTDPLYVLAEGGRVDLDNEVVRFQPATGSLCVDSSQAGFGCFNIYAEQSIYTVDYVPGVKVRALLCRQEACLNYNIGDTITQTDPISIPTPTGTVVFIASDGAEKCVIYVEETSGVFNDNGKITNGTVEVAFEGPDRCEDSSPLTVGTVVRGIPSNPSSEEVIAGIITAISGSTITITPTEGDWNGVVVFAVRDGRNVCLYTLTAPITSVSTQLNSETVCWDAESYIGFEVRLNTLMQGVDGLLYGTLQQNYNAKQPGQLFSIDPVTNTATVLFEFNDYVAYGTIPTSGLIEIAGELYGTCNLGGVYNAGTIWKWNIATKTFTKLHDIDNTLQQGTNPTGTLLNKSGVLYGTCSDGGANGFGTLFSYNIGTDTFTKLADFGGGGGTPENPYGPLTEVNPGELWGTSSQGGTNNNGTIFRYTISSGLVDVIINLDNVPNTGTGSMSGSGGGVHLGSDGNVYFNTQGGGTTGWGTICQITDVATTPTLNILYQISNPTTEGLYFFNLCPIYIDGYLYGATSNGGDFDNGTLYKLNVATGFFTKLHDFTPQEGANPRCGRLFPIGDELFAMSNRPKEGSADQYGQIFKYNIVTDEYTNIKALNSQAQTNADIALNICDSITNPDYTCHTVGGCVYIDGPAGENGYTLALKTVVTYDFCYYPTDRPTDCAPTIGDHLYNGSTLIGTIQTVTVIPIDPPNKFCGTMTVELANNEYAPQEIEYIVDETGCTGNLDKVTGSTLSYVVTPFAGGTEPVNLPCYYNVPFDVITEYPLSQKLTKAEIDYLVANNLLIPGTYYRIIDADFFLYGGTEIVIQAVAPDKFNDVGMGKFYVPKYDKEQGGYGIWNAQTEEGGGYNPGDTVIWGGLVWTYLNAAPSSNAPSAYNLYYPNWSIPGRVKITISGISGTFNVGDLVYGYDSDFEGLVTEVGTDYLIVMAPPSFFAYPTWESPIIIYDVDSGAQATMDSVTLHADYFSDLVYNVRWDEIKYDYANDFISYRKDNSGNSVNQERWEYDDYGAAAYRGILGMQWGNDFDDDIYKGIADNTVFGNSYVEIINFQGGRCLGNSFINTTVYNNIFRPSGISSFSENIFNNAVLFGNNLDSEGSISRNNVRVGTIIFNYVNGSINNNILTYDGTISNVTILSGCGVLLNTLSSSYVQSGTLDNGSLIRYNILNNTTLIANFNFFNSYIQYTTLNACTINFSASGALTNKAIQYLNGTNGIVSASLAGATIIYGNYPKDLINNAAGTPVLRYINAATLQVITAVTT